jgi:hypothetical protein
MTRSPQSPHILGIAVVGAALGAAAMYIFDPNKGRRRRALFRDKARRSLTTFAHALSVSARDIGHRAQGVAAIAKRALTRDRATDDLVLIERVRARMGRIVSHPHAVQIGARNGRVTLSGPILPNEATPLLEAVRAVPGVASIEDHLVIFDRPESIPSLQGGRTRENRPANRRGERNRFWRNAAVVAGGALAITALTRNSYSGSAKMRKR